MHPNTAVAIADGRRRALERRREQKEAGQIERVWGGSRRARGLPPLSRDPTIRRAQRILERLMKQNGGQVGGQVTNGKLQESLSKTDKLSHATDLALDCVTKILALGVDPSDVRLLAQVKDTALNIISAQIRLDALKELHARGDVPAAKLEEEQRLMELAFADLGVRRARTLNVPEPPTNSDASARDLGVRRAQVVDEPLVEGGEADPAANMD